MPKSPDPPRSGIPGATSAARSGISPAIIAAVGIAVAAALALWFVVLRKGPPPQEAPVLTQEARAYVRAGHLELSDVSMSAKQNFAKQTLVEVTGKIKNSGDRPVKYVEITCVFHDVSGQAIFRERVPIVRENSGGLLPGQTKPFRLAFDTIPGGWNQILPDLVIAQIQFGS